MSEVKHTPGEWFTHVKETHPGEIQIGVGPFDADGWPEWNIAECFGGLDEGEQEANARLIAAAPEMLEALPDLSHVISWLENGCDSTSAAKELRIHQARIDAVRSKATGSDHA